MSHLNSDRVYADYRQIFNSKYGSGLSRRTVDIYVPIVNNFTFPLNRYNNGYVQPPYSAKKYQAASSAVEPQLEERIKPYGSEVFRSIDTNPNYRGDGTYNPEERKYAPLFFELPEFAPSCQTRLSGPAKAKKIPLEIRRQGFI